MTISLKVPTILNEVCLFFILNKFLDTFSLYKTLFVYDFLNEFSLYVTFYSLCFRLIFYATFRC